MAVTKKTIEDIRKTEAEMKRELEETRKKMAEMEGRTARPPPVMYAGDAAGNVQEPPRCFRCGEIGHYIRNCPKRLPGGITSRACDPNIHAGSVSSGTYTPDNRPGQTSNIWPVSEKRNWTCISVTCNRRTITAFLDTGSDITIAGLSLARKHKWKIYPYHITAVQTATRPDMMIDGISKVPFKIGTLTLYTTILISADMTGLILGIDWMQNQECLFDCAGHKVQIRGEWIPLQREPVATNVRRIYVNEDVELPPMQQTPVNARVSSGKPINYVWNGKLGSEWIKELKQYPYDGVLESDRIKSKPYVYSARCVIPARTIDLKVPFLNTKGESQMIPRGTELGEVHIVEEVRELNKVEDGPVSDLTPSETEALKKIMERLSPDLTKDQRQKAWSLLVKYCGIISVGDQDIGRTDLVEYHIDTSDNRPIRQPIHRHPFQHLEWIDKEVEEMRKHGIVEPAASLWASNVVLVKKKDGTLRFCMDYRRLNSVTR